MFLFLVLICTYSIAVDSLDSDSNTIQLSDIKQHPTITLELSQLNPSSQKIAETFSKDLFFYYETGNKGPVRSIRHRYFSELSLQPYENTSRVRAFDDNHLYWLKICNNKSEIVAYNFKKKFEESLIQFNYEVVTFKLSKVHKNRMWVISNSTGFFHDDRQNNWLTLIDIPSKKIIKEVPFKLISKGHNAGNFKIVEMDNDTCIIYCRYGGEYNAWLFDMQTCENKMQLPYTHVHTCKTNQARNIIAIDHNDHEICICSSSNPELALYSFTIDPLTPQAMRFLSDHFLIVTARDNFSVPALKTNAHSRPFDNSTNGEFRKRFESLKMPETVAQETNENQKQNAGVYIFDLAQKKEIFKKNLCLKYGFRTIKPYFDEEGSLKPNTFALRDYGCFDGEWYMLSINGLIDNK